MGAAPGGTSGSGDEHTRAALLASQHVVQKAEALCERIGAKLMVRQTAAVACALPRCPAHHDDWSLWFVLCTIRLHCSWR